MASMLDSLRELASPAILSILTRQTNESESAVARAFSAAVPAMGATIANRCDDQGFMKELTDLATRTAADPDPLEDDHENRVFGRNGDRHHDPDRRVSFESLRPEPLGHGRQPVELRGHSRIVGGVDPFGLRAARARVYRAHDAERQPHDSRISRSAARTSQPTRLRSAAWLRDARIFPLTVQSRPYCFGGRKRETRSDSRGGLELDRSRPGVAWAAGSRQSDLVGESETDRATVSRGIH